MRFRDDSRAQSVQIGAILLFATLIIALSVYQATVVPSQNADIEYKHSQTVQNQLTDVRNGILRSAATGTTQPASVTLGTQYPSRVFLMNPPPATGTLRTGSYENNGIELSNVVATNDETADFLDGSWTAPTKYLEYEPNYHEYDNAPNLAYGETLLYNRYPREGTTIPLSDQLLVNGNTITLVALNGSVGTTQSGSVSVNPQALSGPYERVQVTNESDEPVELTIPTQLSADTLTNRTGLGGQDAFQSAEAVGDDRVRVTLDPGTYTLRTAKVGVGSGTDDPGPRYLTTSDDRTVQTGEEFTVTVRDGFNNPVGDRAVAVEVNDSSVVAGDGSEQVSDDGEATFTYIGSGADVNAFILGGGTAELEVDFDGRSAGGGGGGGGGGGDDLGPEVTAASVAPQTVAGGATVDLSATVDDTDGRGGIDVAGAEWFRANPNQTVEEADPGTGNGEEMAFVNRNYYAIEDFTDSADTSGWQTGTHTIAFRGEDANGNWGPVETRTVNVTEGVPPVSIDARVDDLTRVRSNQGVFIGSYNLTNVNSSFERVEVRFQNQDNPSQSETISSTSTQAGVRYAGGQSGHDYEIVYDVIYSDSSGNEYIVASETIADSADAQNPSNNADLGTDSTASFTSWEIRDQTQVNNNQVRYRVSYGVTSSGSFSEVRGYALNINGNGGTAVRTFNNRNQNNQDLQPGDGANTQYRVGLLIRDANGAVVDVVTVTDSADNTGRYSGP
ncbi:hypothetical protein [Halobacterium hubeiense]|uniref:hypothetical protein n=1 Tax=Halobacterium hubeiense TaxID=1407499 RepID=UPI003C78E72F